MNRDRIIDLTPDTMAEYGVCGYKDAEKHLELRRKIAWFREYYPKGLRIKALVTEDGGYQGMLEYIPGEHAHRPVSADGYMFIHCVFVGFKKEFKGKGLASMLLEECITESREAGKSGLAVVARKGSFMAGKEFFLKHGFVQVDTHKPDFELLALKFDERSPEPRFRVMSADAYPDGLTIMRSAQCPYSVKNVDAILETAEKMGLKARLVELTDAESARRCPSPFGTFCIIRDGAVISHHPISNTRFVNIITSSGKQ